MNVYNTYAGGNFIMNITSKYIHHPYNPGEHIISWEQVSNEWSGRRLNHLFFPVKVKEEQIKM